jgi:protocatechuate 3,4-dioxygenase beta subunit
MTTKRSERLWGRREITGGIALLLGGFALACSGNESAAGDASGDAGGDPDDAGGDGAASSDSTASSVDSGGSATEWASGGTKSMTGDYPDPFATPATACAVLVAATQGPCTEAADQVRKDISEGYTGLPMRLALRVVDSACNPIAGAKVKVWHTQITGSYSGDTPNNGMCLKEQSDSAKHYFRGVQTSDDNGRVDFDSCFPGWYRGRTVHVHYTVSLNGKSFTSQLVWDQTLVAEIFANHPEYKGYGQPDTPNATDNVVGNANLATYVVTAARMTDGAMLASKQIVANVT